MNPLRYLSVTFGRRTEKRYAMGSMCKFNENCKLQIGTSALYVQANKAYAKVECKWGYSKTK